MSREGIERALDSGFELVQMARALVNDPAECDHRRGGRAAYWRVNNAGVFSYLDISPPRRTDRTHHPAARPDALEKNCRAFGADMAQRGSGYILNMSSYSLWMPFPGMALYTATKAYVRCFSKAFAKEVAERGVRVTAVSRRRGDRPLRALAQMAAYRPAAGRADFTRQLCAAGAARAMARPPLHRPRLVEPPVRTAVLLHARLRDAPYPPLHDPLPALNGLGAGLRPAGVRSRRR